MLKGFETQPAASAAAISQCEAQLGLTLPADYAAFLRESNGGEGYVPEGRYLVAFGTHELAAMNEDYEVATYAPGFLLFGSNMGGEAFFFDTRNSPWPVVQIPFVGMTPELAELLAASFREFVFGSGPSAETGAINPAYKGKEIFEIHPIILGGSPSDPKNKTLLSREDHIQMVRWWNKKVAEMR